MNYEMISLKSAKQLANKDKAIKYIKNRIELYEECNITEINYRVINELKIVLEILEV